MNAFRIVRILLLLLLPAGIMLSSLPAAASDCTQPDAPSEAAVKSVSHAVGCAAGKTAPSETVPDAPETSREQFKHGRILDRRQRDCTVRLLRLIFESRADGSSCRDVSQVARQVRLQI